MNLQAHKRFKWYMEIKVINLTLLPTEEGGGWPTPSDWKPELWNPFT